MNENIKKFERTIEMYKLNGIKMPSFELKYSGLTDEEISEVLSRYDIEIVNVEYPESDNNYNIDILESNNLERKKQISEQLKALGLEHDTNTIDVYNDIVEELKSENIEERQLKKLNLKRYKDISDYVFIYEKFVEKIKDDEDNEITIIDIHYSICNRPIYGDGYFYSTDPSAKEISLDDYLDRNVYHRYDDNKDIKVRKIIKE